MDGRSPSRHAAEADNEADEAEMWHRSACVGQPRQLKKSPPHESSLPDAQPHPCGRAWSGDCAEDEGGGDGGPSVHSGLYHDADIDGGAIGSGVTVASTTEPQLVAKQRSEVTTSQTCRPRSACHRIDRHNKREHVTFEKHHCWLDTFGTDTYESTSPSSPVPSESPESKRGWDDFSSRFRGGEWANGVRTKYDAADFHVRRGQTDERHQTTNHGGGTGVVAEAASTFEDAGDGSLRESFCQRSLHASHAVDDDEFQSEDDAELGSRVPWNPVGRGPSCKGGNRTASADASSSASFSSPRPPASPLQVDGRLRPKCGGDGPLPSSSSSSRHGGGAGVAAAAADAAAAATSAATAATAAAAAAARYTTPLLATAAIMDAAWPSPGDERQQPRVAPRAAKPPMPSPDPLSSCHRPSCVGAAVRDQGVQCCSLGSEAAAACLATRVKQPVGIVAARGVDRDVAMSEVQARETSSDAIVRGGVSRTALGSRTDTPEWWEISTEVSPLALHDDSSLSHVTRAAELRVPPEKRIPSLGSGSSTLLPRPDPRRAPRDSGPSLAVPTLDAFSKTFHSASGSAASPGEVASAGVTLGAATTSEVAANTEVARWGDLRRHERPSSATSFQRPVLADEKLPWRYAQASTTATSSESLRKLCRGTEVGRSDAVAAESAAVDAGDHRDWRFGRSRALPTRGWDFGDGDARRDVPRGTSADMEANASLRPGSQEMRQGGSVERDTEANRRRGVHPRGCRVRGHRCDTGGHIAVRDRPHSGGRGGSSQVAAGGSPSVRRRRSSSRDAGSIGRHDVTAMCEGGGASEAHQSPSSTVPLCCDVQEGVGQGNRGKCGCQGLATADAAAVTAVAEAASLRRENARLRRQLLDARSAAQHSDAIGADQHAPRAGAGCWHKGQRGASSSVGAAASVPCGGSVGHTCSGSHIHGGDDGGGGGCAINVARIRSTSPCGKNIALNGRGLSGVGETDYLGGGSHCCPRHHHHGAHRCGNSRRAASSSRAVTSTPPWRAWPSALIQPSAAQQPSSRRAAVPRFGVGANVTASRRSRSSAYLGGGGKY
eukprot:TRINITY_DN40716_c0_g1_i1.p1 TRINITY_DN40716_c0_g1~~TRINITY_DN40716_c0_g1_i1.p1  ORF type:complete len:1104 (-),score=142.75 TRINITY_DN40716_c0_g1_i1:37-3219(-)